ncbi:MAG: hypothetical protein AB7G13_07810 [Lautropia sp.]
MTSRLSRGPADGGHAGSGRARRRAALGSLVLGGVVLAVSGCDRTDTPPAPNRPTAPPPLSAPSTPQSAPSTLQSSMLAALPPADSGKVG